MRAAAQALVNGIMLAIHGEQFNARLMCGCHHQLTGRDQDFFVGESDLLPGYDCGIGGFQSDDANGGGDDHLCLGDGCNAQVPRGTPLDFRQRCNAGGTETRSQLGGFPRIRNGNKLWVMALNLAYKFVQI